MLKILNRFTIAAALVFLLPLTALALGGGSKTKIFTGTVVKAYENILVLKTTTAAVYTVQTWQGKLTKRYGAEMKFNEILAGDKVEVKGEVWPDNSVNAIWVKNLSLYPHSGTFSGRVEAVNAGNLVFTVQTAGFGLLNIRVDGNTVFKKNSQSSGLIELQPGISVTVKGIWERDRTQILATQVLAKVRLVNIELEGVLGMVSPSGVSVIANGNVIYGVNIANAKLLNKSGKTAGIGAFMPGQTVKVSGKHISGKSEITANLVKNLSLQ